MRLEPVAVEPGFDALDGAGGRRLHDAVRFHGTRARTFKTRCCAGGYGLSIRR